MLEQQPEQSFCFLDRNFVEEFASKETMRQVLSQAMAEMLPDVVTQYYEMLDGLLLAMYFKNPPGRLIRNQWTFPVTSLPDFSDWRDIIKPESLEINPEKLIDIDNDRLGLLRSNEKMSFPSDNSIIKVNKHSVGQRRLGLSRILKDNFLFGITERESTFQKKVRGEDGLRNRDAKSKADKACDFWLKFDNGTRLLVEMQEHREPKMDEIPKSRPPKWLLAKMNKVHENTAEGAEDTASQPEG